MKKTLDNGEKKADDRHANVRVSSVMLRFRVSVLIFGVLLAGCGVLASGACGGGDSKITSPTPAANDTATPGMASTTQVPGRATPSPVPLTPEAGGVSSGVVAPHPASDAGRPDCAPDSAAYDDGVFTVCYPASYPARVFTVASSPVRNFSVELTGTGVAHTPNTLTFSRVGTYTPPEQCQYEAEAIDASAQTSIAGYTAGGLSGVACTARTTYATQFKGQLRIPSGGAITFSANALSDAILQAAKSVLETIRLEAQ